MYVSVCISPVFCGPMTMNLGNRSHVFSLDQMSLCRLSSHGFYRDADKIRDYMNYGCIMHAKANIFVPQVGFTTPNECTNDM